MYLIANIFCLLIIRQYHVRQTTPADLEGLTQSCIVALQIYYDGRCPDECVEARFGISPAPVTPPGSHYLAMDRMAASMESSQPGGARTDKALIEGSSRSITAPFVFGAQDRGV